MNDPSRPSLLERLSSLLMREPGDREQLVHLLRSAYSRNLLDADALSIIEGEHDTHAAVLTEGPAEVLTTVPGDVRSTTELRNRGGSLDWATAWLRVTPRRLFSFAEVAWQGVGR